jgi:hypothetical protein
MSAGRADSAPRSEEVSVLKGVLAAGITAFLSTAAPGAEAGRDFANAVTRSTLEHRTTIAQVTSWQARTLRHLQKRSLYMQRVMHAPLTTHVPATTRKLQRAATPRERARILIGLWRGVHRHTRTVYRNPPLRAELSCIQRYEGGWHDTRNPRYDGGLQMDRAFQARYGAFLLQLKGRAYNWTPLEQIWTAVYAIRGPDHRGFYPWPHTARACRLI